MNYRHNSRFGILFVLTLSLGGCSFLFVKAPPIGYQDMEYFPCTESKTVPVLDGVWAGLNALGAILALADNETADRGRVVLVGTSWAVVSGGAMLWGSQRVDECRAAKAEVAGREEAARALFMRLQPSTPTTSDDVSPSKPVGR